MLIMTEPASTPLTEVPASEIGAALIADMRAEAERTREFVGNAMTKFTISTFEATWEQIASELAARGIVFARKIE